MEGIKFKPTTGECQILVQFSFPSLHAFTIYCQASNLCKWSFKFSTLAPDHIRNLTLVHRKSLICGRWAACMFYVLLNVTTNFKILSKNLVKIHLCTKFIKHILFPNPASPRIFTTKGRGRTACGKY